MSSLWFCAWTRVLSISTYMWAVLRGSGCCHGDTRVNMSCSHDPPLSVGVASASAAGRWRSCTPPAGSEVPGLSSGSAASHGPLHHQDKHTHSCSMQTRVAHTRTNARTHASSHMHARMHAKTHTHAHTHTVGGRMGWLCVSNLHNCTVLNPPHKVKNKKTIFFITK